MFDDQLNNAGQIPNNLPIGEPTDIFAETEIKNEMSVPSADNLGMANPNSALAAGILKPKINPMPSVQPVMPNDRPTFTVLEDQARQEANNPPLQSENYEIKGPTTTKWLVGVIVVVLIVGLLGVGGVWAYNRFFVNQPKENTAVLPAVETPKANESTIPNNDNNQANVGPSAVSDVSSEVSDDRVLFGEPIDKDGDGLDDQKEQEIGTDPNNWDTDSDSLSDGDEVKIWHTDSLKPDTDGDGYLDGAEVKNGYNPAGPGKLFQPPTSTP